MKDCDKKKELSYLKYWNVNSLYGWAMPQNFPVYKFEWIEDTSQFDEDFIKKYNEESAKIYFLILSFLKLALSHGLPMKNVHKVIKFNQNIWL